MSTTLRHNSSTTVAALVLAACLLGPSRVAQADDLTELHDRARLLAHENACRRAEAQLAEGDRFYLVLDPTGRSLTLKLHGAVLREIPIDALEVGTPRRLFVERETVSPVRGRPHHQGRLSPPRPELRLAVEIPEGPDEEGATIMLPPEPETAIAVPARFFLRYEGGVVLEFRAGDGNLSLGQRIADGFSGLFGEPQIRLRVVVDRETVEAFYRSVPDETDLLVR